MSEPELLDVAASYDDLMDAAQALLREEFWHRKLAMPSEKPESEPVETVELSENAEQDDLAAEEAAEKVVATYRSTQRFENLVTLRTSLRQNEALLARALLQQHGIQSFLPDQYTEAIHSTSFDGTVRLQVAEEDVDAAEKILAHPDYNPWRGVMGPL